MKINLHTLGIFFQYLKAPNYKKNLGTFLIFLIITTIFWFLNELESKYVTRINYPIQYNQFPEDKIVVGELPSYLELKVRGEGFKLLEYKFARNLKPIMLRADSYDLITHGDTSSLMYYIPTSSIRPEFTRQLSSDMEILEIAPDTLFFEFTERTSKKIPVAANIEYSFGKQMMLQGEVGIEPDSIQISGPQSVLDTINSVKTKYQEFSDLTSTIATTLSLSKIHKQVEYSTRKVKLRIPVEQYTEGSLKKEITVRNSPDSVIVRTFPSAVNITYLVGLSNYEEVIPELFKVYVDYEDVMKNREQLKVVVEKAPDYLRSYSYTPQKVDYIIERKND
ncbi:MAG: YbbR-like domain-containing protein [Bacteroidales bacterium]|nr:YbbR-like domain-containing protein [Bacteroidales bacterium]